MSGKEPRRRRGAERWGPAALTALFSLPLWADPVAQALGYEVFYLADPKLQAVYASLVQLFGGWSAYAGALRELAGRRVARAVPVTLVSTLLYAGGLYAAALNRQAGLWFLAAGAVLLAGYLWDVRGSRAL